MPELDLPIPALYAIGALLLVAGRRLYWLFVGIAGFVLGFVLTVRFVQVGPEWLHLLAALLLGAFAALAAVFFQKFAVAGIGFLGGAALLVLLADALAWKLGPWIWLAALGAAIVGALLLRALFEIGLVVLSSLAGASMIVQASGWLDPRSSILLLALTAAGILIQFLSTRRPRRESKS